MEKVKNGLHFKSLKLDYNELVFRPNQLTRLTWPLNKTLLSPPLLIRLSFRVAMFSWNHFWWDKVKKHASIYWYKLGKKHWKMMTFLRYVIANSTKNIEKSRLLKNMRQSIDTSWSKSIDPYKTNMWTCWKDAWLYLYKLSKFRSIPSRELSEICSTCISTVRHTRHKFLWVGFFF